MINITKSFKKPLSNSENFYESPTYNISKGYIRYSEKEPLRTIAKINERVLRGKLGRPIKSLEINNKKQEKFVLKNKNKLYSYVKNLTLSNLNFKKGRTTDSIAWIYKSRNKLDKFVYDECRHVKTIPLSKTLIMSFTTINAKIPNCVRHLKVKSDKITDNYRRLPYYLKSLILTSSSFVYYFTGKFKLPSNVELFEANLNLDMEDIPEKTKKIEMHWSSKIYIKNLQNSKLENFSFGHYDRNIMLPKTIKNAKMGDYFQNLILCPKNCELKTLIVGADYENDIDLSNCRFLENIKITRFFEKEITICNYTEIDIYRYDNSGGKLKNTTLIEMGAGLLSCIVFKERKLLQNSSLVFHQNKNEKLKITNTTNQDIFLNFSVKFVR